MADQETLDQVVQRLATQNHLVHFVPGEDGYGGEDEVDENAEAVIRQGIAWAYRDAAALIRGIEQEYITNSKACDTAGAHHSATNDIHGALACRELAEKIERKAEEASRG